MSGFEASQSIEGRPAAFFDLDKTIIAASSAMAFSKPLRKAGLINRRAALRSAYAQLMFAVSGADEDRTERLRTQISTLCTGWDVTQVRSIVNETLHDVVTPLIYSDAVELIASHRESGHDVVVLSATGEEVATPIAELLGATHSLATRMEIVDGRYSGRVDFYCYGDNKATAARHMAERYGYDLGESYAYTDSSTDQPLLETVGRPHAVNPDRALRKLANSRKWPVLTFSGTVSLRDRFTPTTTAAAVGVSALAVGATWHGIATRKRSDPD